MVLANHLHHAHRSLRVVAARGEWIYNLVVEQIALLVKAHYLAAVGKAGVDRHDALLTERWCQQQLSQVLGKHGHSLVVGLGLAFGVEFILNRWLEETLEGIVGSLAHQLLADSRAMYIVPA